MRQLGFCLLTGVMAAWAGSADAVILEDFQFNDADGTALHAAANDAGTGNLFDEDPDVAAVVTNGSGQLDTSGKDNDEFGTSYVDMDDIASGAVYGVMELTYDFDPGTVNAAEPEEIRLSFIQFDPRSTFVTAEFEIERTADNEVILFGNAVGTGSVNTSTDVLGLTQTETMVVVLAANLNNSLMQVHYSLDGGTSFTSLTDGTMDPTRGVGSLRLTLNNDLSDDSVLIDRIYVTDANPYPGQIPNVIPEPSSMLMIALGSLVTVLRPRKFPC